MLKMTKSAYTIQLSPTRITKLDALFQIPLDKDGGYIAAFIPDNPSDKNAYLAKHTKLLNASSINQHTIWLSDTIVGSISRFIMEEQAEITYWIDKRFLGRCIATQALQIFLLLDRRDLSSAVQHMIIQAHKSIREMWAHTNRLNINYANARHAEIEELIYKLA